MTQTTISGLANLPTPALSDLHETEQGAASYNISNQQLLELIAANMALKGVAAARPSANIAGRLYYATDTQAFSRDNGSSWDAVTLAQDQISGLSAALAAKAALASPALTGVPTAPTAAPGTDTTQIATTAFVLANAVGGGAVDSVNGQTGVVVLDAGDVGADPSGTAAAAIAAHEAAGDPHPQYETQTESDARYWPLSTDLATQAELNAHTGDTANPHATTAAQVGAYTTSATDTLLAAKAPLASPALTGTPTVPTAAPGTNTTQAASTAFVTDAVATHEADTSVHGIADTSALYRSGGTDVAVADGGTGASTASAARSNLGLGTAAVADTGTGAANVPTITQADARYGQLAAANTWTAQQQIVAPSAAVIALIAKGAASQTASFQEWQSSAAVPLLSVKPTTGLAAAKLEFASTIANSPWVMQATGQTFLSTFDPMLLLGYNIGTGGVRLNTSDAAMWLQFESNYERIASDFWMEWNLNVISSTGAKTRRPYGLSIDRDDPDTFCAHTFGVHQAANGRVEICAISDLSNRLYDFRYDGFLTIATTTPCLSLSQTGQANGTKNIRSNGGNLQVVNSAISAVIFNMTDAGALTLGSSAAPPSRLNMADGAITFSEMTAPAAPAANSGVLYVEDNGSNLSRLMVRFPTGSAIALGTEGTPAGTTTAALISDASANGRSLITAADYAAMRPLMGVAPSNATYIMQTANSETSAEQALSSLATGYMKVTTGTGVITSQATPIPASDMAAKPSAIAIFRSGVGSTSLTAPAAGLTEPFPRLRCKFDLTNYTQMRIVAYIVTNGPTGGQVAIQYSTDQSSWNYMDNSAGPVCAVDTGSATLSVGAWVTLNAAANADVFLRFVTQNGNASTAFVFGNVDIQIK